MTVQQSIDRAEAVQAEAVQDEAVQNARRQPADQFGDLRSRLKKLQALWEGERVDPNAERIGSLEEQQQSLIDRMNLLVEDLEKLKAETEGGIQNMDNSTRRMIERSEKAEDLREARFSEMVGIMEQLIGTLEAAPSGPGGGVPKSLLDDVESLKGLTARVEKVEASQAATPDGPSETETHLTELEAALRIISRVHLRLDYDQDIVPKIKDEIAEMEREAVGG